MPAYGYNEWTSESGAINEEKRNQLRAELDGIIANIYGLSPEEFEYILCTFPIVKQAQKELTLAEFKKIYSQKQQNTERAEYWLKEIAKHEEGQEFKPAFSYDTATGKREKQQEHAVLKNIAGMLNASGGRILIGVGDDGSIIGLEDDFREFAGKDGFTKAMDGIISHNLGNNAHPHIKTEFPEINGKTICILEITPANAETWYKNRVNGNEEFYIRRQGSTVQLKNKQITDYIKDRWK